ncbi:MAG: hypothetical protein K6T83_13450 [Alicyclobacillus sp.]|nr:hypothetical protein [Alicyclobacillus sp.]
MGHIGFGYGSEWHLMRYMARHRKLLNDKILSVLGKGKCIEWLDFEFDPNSEFLDRELHGLEFLDRTEYAEILETWKIWWPQTGTAPSWDAVAWLHLENGGHPELLLI